MKWIKMYPAKCLRGSLRFDIPWNRRGLWYELLLMAGDSDTLGVIQAGPGLPYPLSWIAQQLGCPLPALKETLDMLVSTERVELINGCIHIVNWSKYQSEYERRQRPGK